MRYTDYSTEDFIQDEFFQQWVYAPNGERDHYWRDFLARHPGKTDAIEEAREFLLLMRVEGSVPDATLQDMRNSLNMRLDAEEHKSVVASDARKPVRRPLRRQVYYRVAASLALVACVAAYFVLVRDDNNAVLPGMARAQYETPKGRQQHIVLADGTNVWLNADSRMRYPEDFTTAPTREVFLEGEAFFDVAENKERPFVVNTPDISIKVLGTAFNVKSYVHDKAVETTLVRGRITLTSKEQQQAPPVTLTPNQQAVFIKDSKEIVLEDNVDSEHYTGWKNGWLVFDDRPFADIKEMLERWYDVTIVMEDEHSLACTFSGKFKDKSLHEVLDIFRSTEDIHYEITDNRVYITGKLCQQ